MNVFLHSEVEISGMATLLNKLKFEQMENTPEVILFHVSPAKV